MLADADFHHVGVATDSIEKTAQEYIRAGYRKGKIVFDPIQKVKITFLEKCGNPLIELVEPVDETSPVRNILNKVGVSAYHFCYEIADIEDSIRLLKKNKYIPLSKPVPAIAFDHRRICFLYHKNVGLIELLEK
jgi:methylmalonyl-CoA/ethylmalonyl-CoA epimerase